MPAQTNISLSKRLTAIYDMIKPGYQHIWDTCCDHGQLGMALLEKEAAPKIHFVDIVPELVESVSATLAQRFESRSDSRSTWASHCSDVVDIPLDKNDGKHLIIIAGIGGDLTKQIVAKLNDTFPDSELDFLLCPIRQHYSLRTKLGELNFQLQDEKLVEDNGRIYEVIFVSQSKATNTNRPTVNKTGTNLWFAHDKQQLDIAKRYLDQTISHYTRRAASKNNNAIGILKDYKNIEITQVNP